MRIIEKLSDINLTTAGGCLTVGNFDGVHLGHQKIIDCCRKTAAKLGNCPTVALTFEPHPVAILRPESSPAVLTPLALKAVLLEQLGVDFLVVIKDSYKLLTLSPDDFVSKFLVKHLSPKAIIEGQDFHFGYSRSGNVETLKKLAEKNNFDAEIIDDEIIDGARVSSSAVRQMLIAGDVEKANKLLNRSYRLFGQVVEGRGKGRQLGFPTANINADEQVIPAEGVYAGFVSVGDTAESIGLPSQKIPAIFSLGRAKTFIADHNLLIEAHIFEPDVEDLYSKFLAMDFVAFIRGQRRFAGEEELKMQIKKDCNKAKEILGKI